MFCLFCVLVWHFSICLQLPCEGSMLIFTVTFYAYRFWVVSLLGCLGWPGFKVCKGSFGLCSRTINPKPLTSKLHPKTSQSEPYWALGPK